MTKSCGQQRNVEVSDGIGALSGFRRHCSPAVIPAQARIQTFG
ncbi:TPA: hypothetical protein ACQUJH_002017 [Neisseria cinerea]